MCDSAVEDTDFPTAAAQVEGTPHPRSTEAVTGGKEDKENKLAAAAAAAKENRMSSSGKILEREDQDFPEIGRDRNHPWLGS